MHITRHTYLCLVSPVAIRRSRIMSSSVNTSLVRKRSTSIFICPWESRDDSAWQQQCGEQDHYRGTLLQHTYVHMHSTWYKTDITGTVSSNSWSKGEADANLCQAETAGLLKLRNGTALLITKQAAQKNRVHNWWLHCTHSTQHTDEHTAHNTLMNTQHTTHWWTHSTQHTDEHTAHNTLMNTQHTTHWWMLCTHSTQHIDEYIGQHCHIRTYANTPPHITVPTYHALTVRVCLADSSGAQPCVQQLSPSQL